MNEADQKRISETHDNVLVLMTEFKAFKSACGARHDNIDTAIEKQDHALFGNSRPGIIERFNKFENRMIAYTCAAVLVVQILAPKIAKAIGW